MSRTGHRPRWRSTKSYLMTTPWRRRPSFFQDVALHREPLVLGPEAAQLLLQGRRVPLAGEGLVAAPGEGLLPGPPHALAEVEGAGDLGQALALLGDELYGLGLELGGKRPSCLRHRRAPGFELTLLTRRPPSVGKSTMTSGVSSWSTGSSRSKPGCMGQLQHSGRRVTPISFLRRAMVAEAPADRRPLP